MRSALGKMCSMLFPLLVLFSLLPPAASGAEKDWLLLDENQGSSFYISKADLEKPKPGVVRVSTRVVYTPEGKQEALKTLVSSKSLENLYETRYRYDIDCSERESRLLEVTHLDKNGGTLKYTNLSAFTEWEDIPPEARMSLVAEYSCR
ncbi:MAG TPA: surface-adhesin E family protein [Geomonas sp.]|nr:surface-adhesin E family protein [Geomonas sp.]